ncbi:MAG TPA: DUF2934 domain-containing protein [Burkholderiales bacterium]|nr:DUF2934 domain-containing protein [Burkholderiales bacterium]
MARAKDSPAPPARTTRPAGRKSPAARPAQAPATSGAPTPEELYRMIQETAYFKAKARNFAPGHEVQDWIEAEAEVRRRIDSRA